MDKQERVARLEALQAKLTPKMVVQAAAFFTNHAPPSERKPIDLDAYAELNPFGAMGKQLCNTMTIIQGNMELAIEAAKKGLDVPVGQDIIKQVEQFPAKTRKPMDGVRRHMDYVLEDSDKKDEANIYLRHIEALRVMMRDEKKELLAEIHALIPPGKYLT